MRTNKLFGAALAAAVMALSMAQAKASALYDMTTLLNQPHPFATTQTAPAVSTPTVVQPVTTTPQRTPQGIAPAIPTETAQTGVSNSRFGERSDGNNGWGAISEVRLGVLNHDEGPFSRNKEDGNPNINAEVLFVSPDLLDVIWSPRPHVGASINTGGDTSQIYAGLSWEWFLWGDIFAGFSLGGAVHDGETTLGPTDPEKTKRKELGCSVLFRESVEVGWMITDHHAISFILDHISNARLCDENEGLENMGLRYGYRF